MDKLANAVTSVSLSGPTSRIYVFCSFHLKNVINVSETGDAENWVCQAKQIKLYIISITALYMYFHIYYKQKRS